MIKININKKLKDINLDINLNIKEGDFIAISGKSGSGKTTLLRIIAGLEKTNGIIKVHNTLWQDNKNIVSTQKRNIGFVFQDYALFPNMNVYENLLYVNDDKVLANRLLKITELSDMKKRDVNSLSGGQKQRVSLCRAMMNNPSILLLDEPLSALDTQMRLKLQDELIILHREFKMTTIMVSHDVSEIYRLASRVIIIDNGKIIKDGTPRSVYSKSNDNTIFEAKVIDILKKDDIFVISLLSLSKVFEIEVNSVNAQNLYIGKIIDIEFNNLKIVK